MQKWRRQVIIAETLQSCLWAGIVVLVLQTPDPNARAFVLIVLLLLGAMSAMTTAPVPGAVYAALAPFTIAIALAVWPTLDDANHLMLLTLTYAGSCPAGWCRNRRSMAGSGSGQAARAGRLTTGLWLTEPIVSSVM